MVCIYSGIITEPLDRIIDRHWSQYDKNGGTGYQYHNYITAKQTMALDSKNRSEQ